MSYHPPLRTAATHDNGTTPPPTPPPAFDPVERPGHFESRLTLEEFLVYLESALEDARKCQWYLNRLVPYLNSRVLALESALKAGRGAPHVAPCSCNLRDEAF